MGHPSLNGNARSKQRFLRLRIRLPMGVSQGCCGLWSSRRLRPPDEAPYPTPHRNGRGPTALQRQNYYRSSSKKSTASVVLKALPALQNRMIDHAEARERGVHRELPNDIFRACQTARLPIDDSDVAVAVKACARDSDGRLSISEFIGAMRSIYERQEQRDARNSSLYDADAYENPAPEAPLSALDMRVTPWNAVPKHAYTIADMPKAPEGDRGRSVLLEGLGGQGQGQPWLREKRGIYEMLPSDMDPQPHKSADRQRRFLAVGGRSSNETMTTLRLSMATQDRGRSGILPASTVIQYLKLHGVWASRPADEWAALLQKHEPPGYTRRVDYNSFLNGLA